MYRNMQAVRGILATRNKGVIHSQLDQMINSVRIFYTSKQDFTNNFPKQDDIYGKIKLIVRRRQ